MFKKLCLSLVCLLFLGIFVQARTLEVEKEETTEIEKVSKVQLVDKQSDQSDKFIYLESLQALIKRHQPEVPKPDAAPRVVIDDVIVFITLPDSDQSLLASQSIYQHQITSVFPNSVSG